MLLKTRSFALMKKKREFAALPKNLFFRPKTEKFESDCFFQTYGKKADSLAHCIESTHPEITNRKIENGF